MRPRTLHPLRRPPSIPQLHAKHRLRSLSTVAPTLKVTDIPAPHCGSIRILSLNRPEARNAISRQLLDELHQQVTSIHEQGDAGATRALILASESDAAFCAGADLKERATFTTAETSSFLTHLRHTFTLLSTLPIPSLSAVAAPALGGGLELALCTSLRVFASTALVGLPETRLAIIPGGGGTHRLPALIGLTRARDLILTGRRVGAAEAYFLGLCDRLVEVSAEEKGQEKGGKGGVGARERVLRVAVEVAQEICAGGPVAVRKALEALEGWRKGERVGQEGESEAKAYDGVVRTEDRDEALRAFREKRKPVYRGR